MKQYNSLWRVAALLLSSVFVLLFASCNNLMKPDDIALSGTETVSAAQAGTVSVKFSIQSGIARTVLPDLSEVDLTKLSYTLSGKYGESEEDLAVFSENEKTLSLKSGAWFFTLYAEDAEKNIVLKAEVEKTLAAGQNNDVQFTLKPLREDSGAINISFSYPAQVGISEVKISGIAAEEESKDLPAGTGTWDYKAADVEAKDYFATFSFYRGADVAAVVSETIQVRKGYTSKKAISLSLSNLKGFVKPAGETLADKLQWIQKYAASDTEYLVEVTADESIAPTPLKYVDKTGISITFAGIDEERIISLSGKGALFSVESPITLILENYITLTGKADNDAALVQVFSGGILVMNGGAKISGNKGYNGGGGVHIDSSTFTMKGGKISRNTAGISGGGVYINNGTFTMKGGEISGNTAMIGGGVFLEGNSTFTKTAGVIYGKDASDDTLVNNAMRGNAVFMDPLFQNNELGENDSISSADTSGWEIPGPITPLTGGWHDGEIDVGTGEELFSFKASASNQFIHIEFGSLANLRVLVYDTDWELVKNQLLRGSSESTDYMSLSGLNVTEEDYYISVRPYPDPFTGSGDYKIRIEESPLLDEIEATDITGDWMPGSVGAGEEEWFKFTAGTDTKLLHVLKFGKLEDLYVQMFDSDWNSVGYERQLYGAAPNVSLSSLNGGDLNENEIYHIRVRSDLSEGFSDYNIGVTEFLEPPDESLTDLTITSGWNSGNIGAGEEDWFEFVAPEESTNQYIHVKLGELTDGLYVQVYNSDSTSSESLYMKSSSPLLYDGTADVNSFGFISANQTYYIRVWPYSSEGSGTYEIGVTEAMMLPPGENATLLESDGWKPGDIEEAGGEEWFKFTPEGNGIHYIHVKFGELDALSVQVLYNVQNNIFGDESEQLNSAKTNVDFFGSNGITYYIKVWPSSSEGSGDYQIAVNDSVDPPTESNP